MRFNKIVQSCKMMVSSLSPIYLEGEVVKGFGRGSKDLDCPTANYSLEVVKSLPPGMEPGVYCGWAQVDEGPVYKMVANIGWCPFYQNKEMSVETHVIHKFANDFYGANLKVCILKYLRGEKNFKSLGDLVNAIKQDIVNSNEKLEEAELQKFKNDPFFSS